MIQMRLIYETENRLICGNRENGELTCGCQGGVGEGWIGCGKCKLTYMEWMNNGSYC